MAFFARPVVVLLIRLLLALLTRLRIGLFYPTLTTHNNKGAVKKEYPRKKKVFVNYFYNLQFFNRFYAIIPNRILILIR